MHWSKAKTTRPEIAIALVAITLLPLYYASYRYRIAHPYHQTAATTRIAWLPNEEDFVNTWLQTHLVEPFQPSAIGWYCNQTTSKPNLIFNLDNANGGIGNVRGNMLDFIFSAIEAGASVILPGMASRDAKDISNVWADKATFEKFFDEPWFIESMGQACPQMTIYHPWANQSATRVVPGNYLPRTRRMDADFEHTSAKAQEQLKTWLEERSEYSEGDLTVVNLERTLWDIDTRSLPKGFRRSFAQILRVHPAIRHLAATVVYRMAVRHHLAIDPERAVPKAAFYGAHLRTEADAANAGWLTEANANFSTQTDAYIADAVKHGLGTIYVASGNASDLVRFQTKAAAQKPPLNVTSKFDLLSADEAEVLDALTWDQQALIDYEVLQRSSRFGGIVKSSFSYNIAMTRNQWLEDHGRVLKPWYVQHQEDGVTFDDGLSRIIGRDAWHEERIPRGMWP